MCMSSLESLMKTLLQLLAKLDNDVPSLNGVRLSITWRKPGALPVARRIYKDLQRIQTYRNVLDRELEPAMIGLKQRFWLLRA